MILVVLVVQLASLKCLALLSVATLVICPVLLYQKVVANSPRKTKSRNDDDRDGQKERLIKNYERN